MGTVTSNSRTKQIVDVSKTFVKEDIVQAVCDMTIISESMSY